MLRALKLQLHTETVHVDLELIRRLPELLRQYAYRIRCILWKSRQQWHLLGVTAAADNRIAAGLAVDLGTTRVVMRLVDLATGHLLAESAFDNPQDAGAAGGIEPRHRHHHRAVFHRNELGISHDGLLGPGERDSRMRGQP